MLKTLTLLQLYNETLQLFTPDSAPPSTIRQDFTFCQVDDASSTHLCCLTVDKHVSHLKMAKPLNFRNKERGAANVQLLRV